MSQQGTLFSIACEPLSVVTALRSEGLPFDVVGAEDDWRQIMIHPRIGDSGSLRLILKTRETDQIFFRRTIPELQNRVAHVVVADEVRRRSLESLIPHFNVAIELTAEPTFAEHKEFLEAMTLIARLLNGVFVIPAGILDSESRELLMADGSSNPEAVLPTVPDWPAKADDRGADDRAFDTHGQAPDPRRVAERMYAMLVLGYRGLLDLHPERSERRGKLRHLADWFWSLNIEHELEDDERHALNQPLGGLSPAQAHDLRHHFEAVMVCAWSLGLIEMLPHDEPAAPLSIAEKLGLFSEETRFVIDSAELRDPLDIRSSADRIMAVHWRLREFELRPQPLDFAQMAQDAWFGQIDLSSIPLVDGDLAIDGKPVAKSDPTLRATCQMITAVRHRAINWLCGHDSVYSRVDIST